MQNRALVPNHDCPFGRSRHRIRKAVYGTVFGVLDEFSDDLPNAPIGNVAWRDGQRQCRDLGR